MKLISLTCPSCNAGLKVENNRKFTFCQYCGTQIYLDDEVKRFEHTYRKIDEAKIKESELSYLLKLKKIEIKEQEKARKRKISTIIYSISLFLVIVGIIAGIITNDEIIGMIIGFIGIFLALLTALYNTEN